MVQVMKVGIFFKTCLDKNILTTILYTLLLCNYCTIHIAKVLTLCKGITHTLSVAGQKFPSQVNSPSPVHQFAPVLTCFALLGDLQFTPRPLMYMK